MSLNRAQIMGNLGKDPKIATFNNGGRAASFSLATTEKWKDKTTGEQRERTEWHNVVIYNDGLIGVVEKYLKKGHKVYVEGKIATRKYTDQSGVEKYLTEIVLQGFEGKLELLGAPTGGHPGPAAPDADRRPASTPASTSRPDFDDDIPF